MQIEQKSSRYTELIRETLFWLFVFALIYPFLRSGFFPTVDGPAHLYNSNLILDHFFSGGNISGQLFEFNAEPEPNWLGHFLLAGLNSFLPSWLAEKTVVVLSVILIPLGFRYLLKQYNKGGTWGVFLIFPLSYTILFYLGFYNFCMSIGLLLFALGLFEKQKGNFSAGFSIVLMLFMLLLYFAHLFSFLVFTGFVIADFLLRVIQEKTFRERSLRYLIKRFWPLLPALLLSLNFILKKGAAGEVAFVPAETLWTWIKESAVLVAMIYDYEFPYSVTLSVLWALLIVVAVAYRFYRKEKPLRSDLWLLIAVLFTALYFIAPDQMASGGYISLRIAMYFTLFALIWLALQKMHTGVFIFSMLVSGYCTLRLLEVHTTESRKLGDDADELYTAAPFIKEGKTVLPLNYTGNWLHSNLATYLGSEKKILVLDNYEASTPHFPMKWKNGKEPYGVAGDYANSDRPCLTIDRYEEISGVHVDYITRWYWNEILNDSCTKTTDSLLASQFEKVFTSPQGKLILYKRK